MGKKLMAQMWNERRLNIGLWLELLVVSVVLWFVVDYLYVTLRTYYEPLGYDIEHTYQIKIGQIIEGTPNYIKKESKEDNLFIIRKWRFVEYLKKHPEVEAVGMSLNRGIHYSGGSEWLYVKPESGEPAEAIKYVLTPGYLKVFRMEGARGESPEELGSHLDNHTFLAGANLFGSARAGDLYNQVNKPFDLYDSFGDSVSLRLGGVLKPIRRNEFSTADAAPGIVEFMDEGMSMNYPEMYIRVKEECDRDFIFRVKHEFEKFLGEQNLMITDFVPVSLLRHNRLRDNMNELRNYSVVMGFLMLNVFLGLLGTFWYRTQQRNSEIALHIVVGSTRLHVLKRLCTEGLLLLLFATLPALLLDFCIAYNGLTDRMGSSALAGSRFPVTVCITFVSMAGMILTGILIPAYRVIKMSPAEALHNE